MIEKLELESLKQELHGLSMPDYATKRMLGEIQKKINEIIKSINNLENKE